MPEVSASGRRQPSRTVRSCWLLVLSGLGKKSHQGGDKYWGEVHWTELKTR